MVKDYFINLTTQNHFQILMLTTKRTSDRLGRIGIDSRIGTDQHIWPESMPDILIDSKSPLASIASILRSTLQMVFMAEDGYSDNPLRSKFSSDQLKSALNNVIVASTVVIDTDPNETYRAHTHTHA